MVQGGAGLLPAGHAHTPQVPPQVQWSCTASKPDRMKCMVLQHCNSGCCACLLAHGRCYTAPFDVCLPALFLQPRCGAAVRVMP